MADCFIWRKSIYNNNFKCNRCGAKLFDTKKGHPTDNVGFDASTVDMKGKQNLWCCKCKNLVGTYEEVDDSQLGDKEKFNPLNGNIDDWLKHKESEFKADARSKAEEQVKKKYIREMQRIMDDVEKSEHIVKSIKSDCEKRLLIKDKQIQELTKEIDSLNAQLKKMEKQLLSGK